MLFVVHYTDRNGAPAKSAAMPHNIAASYARNVSNPRIVAVEVGGVAAPVVVQRVAPGTAGDQYAATKAFMAKAPKPWYTAEGRRGLAEMRIALDTSEAREARSPRWR